MSLEMKQNRPLWGGIDLFLGFLSESLAKNELLKNEVKFSI